MHSIARGALQSEREKGWSDLAYGVLVDEYCRAAEEVPHTEDGAQTTRRYYRRFELVQERVIANESKANGDTLACKVGCAYCCHQRVTAPPHEILTLAQSIGQLPEPGRAALVDRIQRNAERVQGLSGADAFRAQIPCAMLDEKNACSLYDDRPSSCRRYHSVSLRDCEKSFAQPDDLTSKVRLSTPLLAANTAHALGFRKALAERGLDTTNYELHTALSEALADPAGCGARFGRGEKTFIQAICYGDEVPQT